MEIIQAFAAFFVAFAVFSAVLQVVFAYSLQVIAEKNELPDFASFIAWIPILNIYPAVKVGGGDFKKFILGGIGACIALAVVAGGAAAAGFGGAGSGLAGIAFALLVIIYFARLAMGTAERRGLNRWLGLLAFVPIANFLIYPYIAFHDGFKPPNKIGLVLGLLIAFGPLPGQIAIVEQLTQQAQEVAETDLGDGVTFGQAMGGLGATLEIGSRLAMIDGLDPSDPDEASMMSDALESTQRKLDENAEAIGEESYAELHGLLMAQFERFENSSSGGGQNAEAGSAVPPQAMAAIPVAKAAPPLTSGIRRKGDTGFEIPVNPDCPTGTAQRIADLKPGAREWCEKIGIDAGIRHGWMTEYHENGMASAAGEYRDGLRVGVWTRYFDNGVKRVQAEFKDGLQDGVLISWGPDGTKIYEKFFSEGAPASR